MTSWLGALTSPFAPHVCQPRRITDSVQMTGFPQNCQREVKTWIAGVSSPEGIILATGIAAVCVTATTPLSERFASLLATFIVTGSTVISSALLYSGLTSEQWG